MTLPVLRVRHHSVIGGRNGDVPPCASVGPAGEVAALWTTPEGLGPVTSTTVSAAGAWFPDPAAARPAAARITVHTPDLAAVTRIADLALAHIICSPCAARRSQAPDTAHPYKAGRSSFRLRAPPRIRQIPCLPAPGYYRTASHWSRTVLPRVTDYPTSSRTRTAAMRGSQADIDHDGSDPDLGVLRARDLGWSGSLASLFRVPRAARVGCGARAWEATRRASTCVAAPCRLPRSAAGLPVPCWLGLWMYQGQCRPLCGV
jgi:hypothetical protein